MQGFCLQGVVYRWPLTLFPDNQRAYRSVFPPRGWRVDAAFPQQSPSDSHGFRLDDLHQDRKQVEHCTHWPHDLLPWGRRQHTRASRPARQVREQNPDSYQDWLELQNAEPFPAGCVLHPQGVGRPGNVIHGTRAHTAVGSALVQADRCRHHSFQVRNESRWRPAHSELVQVRHSHEWVSFIENIQ